jgi:hypothetical protein
MDRFDEAKHVNTNDTVEDKAPGDVLGIASGPAPKAPGDPTTSYDPDSVAKRRARLSEEEETLTQEEGDHQRPGATGIDMGAGGEGTDIRGRHE